AVLCGRLLDVETGKIAVERVLHVEVDGRVTSVASAIDGFPDDAAIVDLSPYTVLPGLIDMHTHLVGDVQTAGVPSTTTSAAQDALIGVRHARQPIGAGFTTRRRS